MKRGGIVETMGIVVTAIVGTTVLSRIFDPDITSVLLIAAGSTVVTAIVLWFFFRSVRASEKARGDVVDPDALSLAAQQSADPFSEACVLASAACTTGWLDWIHGELWLCADGLLRRSLGIGTTMAHGSVPTVDRQARPKRPFTAAERAAIGKARRTNRWIAWASIAAAETRRGPMTDSFHYRLKSGAGGKLLWLRADGAMSLIEAAAGSRLGDRFTGT